MKSTLRFAQEAPLTRRQTIKASLAGGALMAPISGLTAGAQAADPANLPFDLNDLEVRAEIRARIFGSSRSGDTVFRLTRGHIYGYDQAKGDFKPFFSLLGCNVTTWDASAAPTYRYRMYEAQLYCAFDTDNVLDRWENPFTDEIVDVFHYVTGPIDVTISPEGTDTGPLATLKPNDMEWILLGDRLFLPISSDATFPTPFTRDEWPDEYAGDNIHWHSFINISASVNDLADESKTSVRAISQYQENVTWSPWMRMKGFAGYTLSRGFGEKLLSEGEIPARYREIVNAHTPEIFDRDRWGEPRDGGVRDYIKWRQLREG